MSVEKAIRGVLQDQIAPKEINEAGHDDVSMAKTKVKIAMAAVQKMSAELDKLSDDGDLPSWWVGKVAIAVDKLDGMADYLDTQVEEVQEETLPGKGKDTWMKDGVEMCPEECCGQPVTECKCSTDCETCNCAERKEMMKEEVEYPHPMYDPKTGKKVMAKSPEDHNKYNKMGYTHDKPTTEAHDPKHVKQAVGIASDPRYKGGNMTGAVKVINKLSKGLSDHPQVKAVLRRQNEDINEVSSNKLGDYMKKSSADAGKPGASAQQQDKRIGGQKMADDKLRKADGKSSNAKVAATEGKARDRLVKMVDKSSGRTMDDRQKDAAAATASRKAADKDLANFKKEAYNEPQGQAKSMMSPLHKARMDKEKADRDRDGKLKPGIIKVKKEETGIEEAKKVSSMQIHKVLAPTKNSREGIAALKKAFRVNDMEAKKMLNKVMNEATIPDGQTAMTTKPEIKKKDKDTISKIQDMMRREREKRMNKESLDEISRTMTPMRKKFGGTVDPKKFDMYKKHIKQHRVDEPTVRMVIDNPDDAESKRMMKNKHVAQAVSLRKAAMKESIEEAKKPDETVNIYQSLKKAIDMRGQKEVVFKDGSKAKISVQDAQKAMKMLDTTRMAKAKQMLTIRMMKSHQDFKDALTGKKPKVDPFALKVKTNEEAKNMKNEKFANPAQQAAVMAKLKASGKYKEPTESAAADNAVRRHQMALGNARAAMKQAKTHDQMVKAMNAVRFHQKAVDNAMHSENKFLPKFKSELKELKKSMKETKGAPKGYHFTRSGQLKKGDAGQDGDGGKMLRSDPLDKQRKKIPPLPENDK